MIDPNKMREALVQNVLKSVLPPFYAQPTSIRVTVPPNAISVVEDDKLVVHLCDKRIEYDIPHGANVYRRILEGGFIEYIIEA